jgi:hypothetical protein
MRPRTLRETLLVIERDVKDLQASVARLETKVDELGRFQASARTLGTLGLASGVAALGAWLKEWFHR